jgi:ADP-heptose:LPS heptosyltransferase
MQDENVQFVWFGGGRPNESKIPNSRNFTNLANQLSWRESAAVVSRCELMICVDSAVMHLAALTNRPTLGLYGKTPATWRGLDNPKMDVLEADGMENIKIEEIVKWIKIKLQERLDGSMSTFRHHGSYYQSRIKC